MKRDGRMSTSGKNWFLYLKAAWIEIAVLAGFLFLFAAGMTFLEGGFVYAPLFSTLSAAAGAFAASFYLAAKSKKKGWLFGLIVGGITFCVLTVVGLALSESGITLTTLFRFIILLLASFLGGILGVGKAESRRYL